VISAASVGDKTHRFCGILWPMIARRTKIVCTIGPASETREALEALIDAGMDVARLNFSHGTMEDHARRLSAVRAAAQARGKPVAALQDLCGPKIRTGPLPGGTLALAANQRVTLIEGNAVVEEPWVIPIMYEGLAEDVSLDDRILLDDGRVGLKVIAIEGGRVLCDVEEPGVLRDRVGVHLPSKRLRISALTEKDEKDLAFGLSIGVDYVALSFVRTAADVVQLRAMCERLGRPPPIVAKIETPAAVDDLENIAAASDALMVARGDLGVEFPPERVPVIQKQIIAVARMYRRPVIVATEMLQSMVTAPRPTRAEASDVANAVFDGTDAVMLSAESATGAFPVQSTSMMARICLDAESSPFYGPTSPEARGIVSVPEGMARAAAAIAREVDAKLLVAFTETGATARFVSKSRPGTPIIAFSANETTRRQLALYWGVTPRTIEELHDTDVMVERANQLVLESGLAVPGDKMVAVFGAPAGRSGATNSIRVRVIG